MSHFVYAAFRDDGLCLYVGCTNDVERRMSEHRRVSGWPRAMGRLDVTEFELRADAEFAEAQTIGRLSPANNVRHNWTTA